MSNSCGAHTPIHEHTPLCAFDIQLLSSRGVECCTEIAFCKEGPFQPSNSSPSPNFVFSCSRPREIDIFLTTSIARIMSGERMTRPSRQSGRLAQTPQPHPLSDAARTNDYSSAHQRIECIHGARASSRTSIPVGNRLGEPCGELLRPVECDYPALSFKNCGDVQIRDDPSLWQADSQATR